MKIVSLVIIQLLVFCGLSAQETIVRYLSGKDKDHTVAWDFRCSSGMKSNQWGSIAVPSNWELLGYGTYNYGKDAINPGEKGEYRYSFPVPADWKNKKVFIVFEAAQTDTKVSINGQQAGPVHQGGFYAFEYDISHLLNYGSNNLLEVEVHKKSANESINRAERQSDFWIFGGIYRPVYLKVLPQSFIERIAIDAKADGRLSIDVFTQHTRPHQTVEAVITDLKGRKVASVSPTAAQPKTILSANCRGVKPWNPEQPNLYQALVTIKEGNKTIHRYSQRFGFRTIEIRPSDGIYVNGTKIIFKGVNRHSTWPQSGKTLSREVHLLDIGLMKQMNMNAVRMSHYPPDREFLDLCDSLGLLALDELTGWQKAYDTATARRLVKELVTRDVNHPSIILWANGNEGGWNRAVDGDFKLYDPQNRLVYHPWERFNHTDTRHYPNFSYLLSERDSTDIFFPTEFMHGLFDGGHAAGLQDFWTEMMKNPRCAGGFLWSFHDEGVHRRDGHDSIDIAGNLAPDGILGPYREKEASFYSIKEIWSPVKIWLDSTTNRFNEKVQVENRYLFSDLAGCRFEWKWLCFNGENMELVAKGSRQNIPAKPGRSVSFTIPMLTNGQADALWITAFDAQGSEIITRSWAIPKAKNPAAVTPKGNASVQEAAGGITVSCDGIQYRFDKNTGYLKDVKTASALVSLDNGPALAGASLPLKSFDVYARDGKQFLQLSYRNDSTWLKLQWIFEAGKLPELQYSYSLQPVADYSGITFSYPEEKITGMQWLGRGPYRVWKNRTEGMQWGYWQKPYNNTITGESWVYPEFKGWHAQVAQVTVQNKESDFTIFTRGTDLFFQMLQPARPVAARNNNTTPTFPGNSIGFFNQVSPIGTKFQDAGLLGPQSQRNVNLPGSSYSGVLWFDFSDRKKN